MCFVGITRARRHLLLTQAAIRSIVTGDIEPIPTAWPLFLATASSSLSRASMWIRDFCPSIRREPIDHGRPIEVAISAVALRADVRLSTNNRPRLLSSARTWRIRRLSVVNLEPLWLTTPT